MESWSPLMNAQILNDETIKDIAQELGKSPAQSCFKMECAAWCGYNP